MGAGPTRQSPLIYLSINLISHIIKYHHHTDAEKSVIKKYESKFITLDPAPEYTIDRINNGLYR